MHLFGKQDRGMTLEALADVQRRFSEAGFDDDLVVAGSCLRSVTTGLEYDPATLQAAEVLRFEGMSDPDDEAVLVAVATRAGQPLGTFTAPYGPSASAEQAELLEHLHRVVVSEEERAKHTTHDHVTAIFPDRGSAEAAITDLREVGLGSEQLGVAIRGTDAVVFEYDEDQDLAHDAKAGAGVGAILGVLGGMLLFTVAGPGIGLLGAGGIAALAASSGYGGAMLGFYTGVFRASGEFDEHEALRETRLQPGEVLVVACGHHQPESVKNALQRHAGRLVPPVGKAQK